MLQQSQDKQVQKDETGADLLGEKYTVEANRLKKVTAFSPELIHLFADLE